MAVGGGECRIASSEGFPTTLTEPFEHKAPVKSTNMMRRVASVDCLIENAFYNETILALWGLDPRFALEQARAIFDASRAPLPPANAAFRLVWFLGKRRPYHTRSYIRFNFPPPEPLRDDNAWDRPRLIEDLAVSGGYFIETEPAIVEFWDLWRPLPCVCFFFKLVSRSLKRLLVSVLIILFFCHVH